MWSKTPTGIIKTRGVIVLDGKIFLCKFSGGGFFGLPGGTLDLGESLKAGLEREMFEELGIHAKVGALVHTQEIIREHESMFDFWYWIDNAEDFANIDLSGASHGFEHEEVGFYSLDELRASGGVYRPDSMARLLAIWIAEGPVFVEQN